MKSIECEHTLPKEQPFKFGASVSYFHFFRQKIWQFFWQKNTKNSWSLRASSSEQTVEAKALSGFFQPFLFISFSPSFLFKPFGVGLVWNSLNRETEKDRETCAATALNVWSRGEFSKNASKEVKQIMMYSVLHPK
jgi:hypothetical protein